MVLNPERFLSAIDIKVTSCAIMPAPDGRYLLQLRDGNPGIRFPHQWTNFGGVVEQGEDPKECIQRELKEELGLIAGTTDKTALWKVWRWEDFEVYVFEVPISGDLSTLHLTEGAGMRFFTKDEILAEDLAFCHNEIYREYFKEKTV